MPAKKLSKLTDEQEALMPAYRDKWLQIGLATGAVDMPQAQRAIKAAYKAASFKPPKVYLRSYSPIGGALVAMILQQGVRQGVEQGVRQGVWQQIYGAMDAPWLSLYNYFLEVCGLACCVPLQGLMNLATCCGWWAPYSNVAIVQDRPSIIAMDGQGRLHHESAMAVSYPDTWGIYAWHGVLVDKEVIEHPEQITLEHITKENNAEKQRVLLERYGWDRYLDDTHAVLRDCDTEPSGAAGLRGLYQCIIQHRAVQILACCCASTGKTFHLEVPPNIDNCRQAVAWLANTEGKPLNLLVRT